jgi:hypothetical protein
MNEQAALLRLLNSESNVVVSKAVSRDNVRRAEREGPLEDHDVQVSILVHMV